EEKQQHHDHENSALDEIRGDGADGSVHESGAVVERLDCHTWGQCLSDRIEAFVDRLGDLAGVGSHQHHHDPRHGLASPVTGHRTLADHGCKTDLCHLTDADGNAAVSRRNDNVPKIVETLNEAFTTNQTLLAVVDDVAAAGILIIELQGLEDI